MKKLFAFIAVIGMLSFGASFYAVAQDNTMTETETAQVTEGNSQHMEEEGLEGASFHRVVKKQFIQGGAVFMSFVLLALILGLALSIERIIYLNLSTTNTKKLVANFEDALNNNGVEAAKDVCRNTRGPIASIFYQGLDRIDENVEIIEKSVISYGSVQMGLLEKGLSWIGLMIGLAPMLGFMGTVIGMINAFDSIQSMGTISPAAVAGGIKIALITTVSGLIVAMILQIFYNYCTAKIDSIVNNMENASITLLDILVKYNMKK